eukprot:TRINITY_DN4296_c0_g1_i3.p1 TRINITY_DN4296_c0_g1~~TRINITY_DN4296_c0_g1_i3.p1  ORF type:complete len:206 (+),score=46.42 TRINITY_DN4296_c0_g1_i3:804-1421(+)
MDGDKLLQILGVQRDVFDSLPSEFQHEALSTMIRLMPELQPTLTAARESEQPTGLQGGGGMQGFGAQPAALTTGNKVQKQRLGGTIVEKFLFEQHSAEASLALGVKTSLELRETSQGDREELLAELQPRMEAVLGGRSEALLGAVPSIFEPEAQCVVCLNAENESAPDCVLYQCGHRCVHMECSPQLRRCPMCRASIAAVLKIEP